MTTDTTTPAAPTPSPTAGAARRTITIERSHRATLDEVWSLWTTPEGIESWWGPEGFTVTVQQLDLRAGGELHYTMTATDPEQVAVMQRANMPLAHGVRTTFTEVVAPHRLVCSNLIDFLPGVEPYTNRMQVELHATGDSVRMVLTLEAMPDEMWTQRSLAGWESQLGKLARRFAS